LPRGQPKLKASFSQKPSVAIWALGELELFLFFYKSGGIHKTTKLRNQVSKKNPSTLLSARTFT
jgi:hypothetical protein